MDPVQCSCNDAVLLRYYVVGEGANFQDVVSLSPPYPNLFGKTGLYKAACYALSPCLMEAHRLRIGKCNSGKVKLR